MFSRLSSGITHAKDYNQAARTVGCIAEVLRCANRDPKEMESLSFSLFAPAQQIEKNVFGDLMTRESIGTVVKQRVAEYDESKSVWYESWFLPTLESIDLRVTSWESILQMITDVDAAFGSELTDFYERCVHYNRPLRDRDS